MKKKLILLAIVVALIPLAFFALPQLSLVVGKAIESTQEEATRQKKIADREKMHDKQDKGYLEVIEPLRVCSSDDDCIRFDFGPCGCGGGGTAIAINSQNLDIAKQVQKETYPNRGCFWDASKDPTCSSPVACENSRCVIQVE